jgi:uncharacterized protein
MWAGLLRIRCFVLASLIGLAGIAAAPAQEKSGPLVEKVNRATVTLITGDLYSTGAQMAQDLGSVINHGDDRRLLPVLGINSSQNVTDLLLLRGVDMALVNEDTLQRLDQSGKIPELKNRLRYIAELGLDKVYIIAGSAFPDVRSLAGQPVNLGPGGTADTTASLLLEALGVAVLPIAIDHRLAIERIGKGELAATILVGANLRKLFADVEPSSDLRLLPIAFDPPRAPYVPYVLEGNQPGGLVQPGTSLKTVAVPLVLVTNNWPPNHFRFKKVQEFVNVFRAGFDDLQQPPHAAEWRGFNPAVELAGWQRFAPAIEAFGDFQPDLGKVSELRKSFEKFVTAAGTDLAKLTDAEREKLFEQFLRLPDNGIATKMTMRLVTDSGVAAELGTLTLSNTSFEVAGRSEFGLLIQPELKGIKPGPYALHVHENPSCGPKLKDGVMVAGLGAGTHLWLSGTGTLKGKQFGSHLGDLPDLIVGANQTATGEIVGARLSLADIYGRAIMIHASSDDVSPRMACGVIR